MLAYSHSHKPSSSSVIKCFTATHLIHPEVGYIVTNYPMIDAMWNARHGRRPSYWILTIISDNRIVAEMYHGRIFQGIRREPVKHQQSSQKGGDWEYESESVERSDCICNELAIWIILYVFAGHFFVHSDQFHRKDKVCLVASINRCCQLHRSPGPSCRNRHTAEEAGSIAMVSGTKTLLVEFDDMNLSPSIAQ